jgi:hypothetical protein
MMLVAFCLNFPNWPEETLLGRALGGIAKTGVDAATYIAGFAIGAMWFGPAVGMAGGFALTDSVRYIVTQLSDGNPIGVLHTVGTIVISGAVGLLVSIVGGFALYLIRRGHGSVA